MVNGEKQFLFTIHHLPFTNSVTLRQSEDALGDDVALDFAGALLDGVAARAEVGVLPGALVKILELAVGAEYLLRGLLRALVHLAPVEFLNRALGAGRARLAQRRQGAVGVEAQDFQLKISLRELLPDERVTARGPSVALDGFGARDERFELALEEDL